MSTDPERLAAIKSQALATLASVTATPKPSYQIDGQTVSWGEYIRQLTNLVEWCDRQLAGDEPFEFHTEAYT
jgi:hypothetical protein